MKKGLVSVVIPVFNGERFLDSAIKSTLDQDYKPIEIIVVDDGSTDNTAKIVKSYNNIQYFYQENQGPSVARNTGISNCQGEFIAFLDSDDLWFPNKLRVQVKYLQKNHDIGFVFAHRKMIVEENIDKPPWYKPPLFDNESPVLGASAMLARKSIFKKIMGYNPDFRFGENAEFLTRANEAGIKMNILPETLVKLRLHNKNQSYQLKEMRSSILKALKTSIDRRRNN